MRKFNLISILLILVITITSYGSNIEPDLESASVIKYGGTITSLSNFSEDGTIYTGSNPARNWVNWNGQWCFIKSTTRVESGKWECEYAYNEWLLIQNSPGNVNKYKLYYFDGDYLSSDTLNGYEGFEYNASKKLLSSESGGSKLKVQVYEDLEWFEYPEDSNQWYYGYEEGEDEYEIQYKFLKNGYAIIIDRYYDSYNDEWVDEDTYTLYLFNSSFYAQTVSGFQSKTLEYIKAKITSEMNNNPAILETISIMNEGGDIDDWDDISSAVHNIIIPEVHRTTSYTRPSDDVPGKYAKYYGDKAKNLYNFDDMFSTMRGSGQYDKYDVREYSLTENTTDLTYGLAPIGWRYGDSPLYSFHTYIRMPDPEIGGYDNTGENVVNASITTAQINMFSPLMWLPDPIRTAFAGSYLDFPKPLTTTAFKAVWKENVNVSDTDDYVNNLDEYSKGVSWTGATSETVPPAPYKCPDPVNHTEVHKHDELSAAYDKDYDGSGHGWNKKLTFEGPEGTLNCKTGDIRLSVDLSHLNELVGNNTPVERYRLVFPNETKIYVAPEQNGSIDCELRETDISNLDKQAESTKTIQPWHIWEGVRGKGTQFGFTYPKSMTEGVMQKESADISTINILSNAKSFYSHNRQRYKTIGNFTDWKEVYVVSRNFGTIQDNIMVKVSAMPVNKPTLHVDAVWDGWANTMNGIVNTGITKANGDDRDVVVDGGSTMYISTKNTPKHSGQVGNNDLDVAKLGVTVYINACYGNEQNFTPQSAGSGEGDEKGLLQSEDWKWYIGNGQYTDFNYSATRNWTDTHVGGGFFPIVAGQLDDYFLGDELPAFKMSARNSKWYNKTHNKIYKLSEAAQAIMNFFNDMHKNLGHYKLEKVMAEGVFTQGQEDLFDKVAKTVSGIDTVDTFGSFGQGNKSYNKARTEQTSNIGNKLSSDSKYQLNNAYKSDDPYSNTIGISCDNAEIHTFWAEIDIHGEGNTEDPNNGADAFLKIGKDGRQTNVFKLSEYKPNNILQIQKLLNALGDEWKEVEIDTGFLRDILTSTIHQVGARTTRPAEAAMGGDVGNRPYGSKWYNEGTQYFFLTRGQAEYTLKLNEEKVEVMDPALCGLTENTYDIRNWNVNEDESYTVDGVKIPLKNKVRTFRYQLSPYFSYEGRNSNFIPANNQTTASTGDTFYLGRIQHPLKGTANEGSDRDDVDLESDDRSYVEGGATNFSNHMAELVDDYFVDVFCKKVDFALKSKLMYLTNATVQDNQK